MTTKHIDDLKHFQKLSAELGKACPDVMGAFGQLHHAATADGALSLKTKELIAIGISIAIKCNACIDAHVKAALEAGVTPDEIKETVGVAIMMGGGPSTAYGALVIEAMNEFLTE